MLKTYLKKIYEIANLGDATEVTYYSTLQVLLEKYVDSVSRKNLHIIQLPKKTDAGNPDFKIREGEQNLVGYIEAKAPNVGDLDGMEESEQLKRYRRTFPNLILTNFLEFRLYRNGSLEDKVSISRPFNNEIKSIPSVEREDSFFKLFEKFFSFSLPKVYDAEALAKELAKWTRYLRDEVIIQELKEEEEGKQKNILGFYDVFKEYLIWGLKKDEFADLYSQTITYGLFAARMRSENSFNRKLAYDNISQTIGILRDVFQYVSLGNLPQQMEWIIDDISEVLAITDVKNLLGQYFREGKGADPIVYFYETFLDNYDRKTRKKRGVYYTPEPVVSYIIRSLNKILKDCFNRQYGFASESVTVLDPAAGTLTFLADAAKLAVDEFVTKYGEGGKENFIRSHILENFYAFELMMAPYAVGHLKMFFLLEELGYKLQQDDRFKLYLTNTLEMEELAQTEFPVMVSLSKESQLAGRVKKETSILVILGNPPYSGISANASEKYTTIKTKKGKEKRRKIKTWIGNLIEDYKFVDSKPLSERKHWLQDDYVKFIRFAQWKIIQAGEGAIGFITNHGYLDNPTFRGMRQSLLNSFNEIYVLDLHGNLKKKEKCPDGSKDANVFDIRQGVTITICIKKNSVNSRCEVYHSEVWGLRKFKYDWLLENEITTTKWKKLSPKSPYYFFVPREEKGIEIYEKYWEIKDIFPISSVGVVTARDKFVIDFDKTILKRRIEMFRNLSMPDELIKQTFKLKDTSTFKFRKSREMLSKDENWDKYFTEILYRPFDKRNICYTNIVVERPLLEVMHHMMQENLGLIMPKQFKEESGAFVTQDIIGHKTVSAYDVNYLFPLYLYPDADKKDLFSHKKETAKREPNINQELFNTLSAVYKRELSPEDISHYIYAVLYSNTYRNKYCEFLRMDFPRIPFTKDYELFSEMTEYGKRLVDLHLLKSLELDPPVAKFQGKGDNKVEKLKYDEKEMRAYINQNQYFEGITKGIWEYQIGGYQVCNKWLKDRKGRQLDDIRIYCNIVTALQKTVEIQKEIDDIYLEVEKATVEFKG